MEFITVSKDMKDQVGKNAASYGNSGKMVVLIDDEKLERMATDESFRRKYEGIIASAGNKMTAAKNSLASTGASIKNFGMTVDSNGNESFFATVEKSLDQQKERIAKKAAEKKEQKAKEKKKAQKEAAEERLEKSREEKAQKTDDTTGTEDIEKEDEKEYITFEAKSMDELLSKLTSYTFDAASAMVMTESERMLGTQIDFKG